MKIDSIQKDGFQAASRLVSEALAGRNPVDLAETLEKMDRETLEVLASFGVLHMAANVRYFQEHR